jgi:hypothetical protein
VNIRCSSEELRHHELASYVPDRRLTSEVSIKGVVVSIVLRSSRGCDAIAMTFRARKWIVWHLTLSRLGHEGRLGPGGPWWSVEEYVASSWGGVTVEAGGPWA